MEAVDCVVAGAGVVGLAIARAVAQSGREVLILERNERHGLETSSRNSEVIHAGIHYPPGSLKARHCVRGRALLYEYCAARSIPHRRCGKLIVASGEASHQALQGLRQAGAANGVDDLELLDAAQAGRLEPALRCDAALLSPSTGIVDVHAYMLALLADAEGAGARLVLRTSVERLFPSPAGIGVLCQGEPQPTVRARWVVNAAGLWATEVAAGVDGLPAACCPRLRYAKGNYFSLAGRAPFSHLIYPLPAPDALGVHLTLDLAGQARFGPDLEWVETIDYAVDSRRLESFVPQIRSFWPEVPADRLVPAYAGIRPKLAVAGSAFADFRIDGPADHGVDGLINLFGIESPGLTASLAIAAQVAALIGAG